MRNAFSFSVSLLSATMLLGLGGAPGEAMPLGSLPVAPADVTLVAYGCGPGWVHAPNGHCHSYGFIRRHFYHPYYPR
jgi:hypothetical protein